MSDEFKRDPLGFQFFSRFSDPFGLGLRVYENPLLWDSEWVFPDDPFIEYEPSDERWCRYCKKGHEKGPQMIRVGLHEIHCHPSIAHAMREKFGVRSPYLCLVSV